MGKDQLKTASEILTAGAEHISNRASSRDMPEGERSMKRCVEAFNALEGTSLTETQGWRFLAALKYARATAGTFNIDDYEDGAAYLALAAECEQKVVCESEAEAEEDEISEVAYPVLMKSDTGRIVAFTGYSEGFCVKLPTGMYDDLSMDYVGEHLKDWNINNFKPYTPKPNSFPRLAMMGGSYYCLLGDSEEFKDSYKAILLETNDVYDAGYVGSWHGSIFTDI